jgi:hypothetical protein
MSDALFEGWIARIRHGADHRVRHQPVPRRYRFVALRSVRFDSHPPHDPHPHSRIVDSDLTEAS